MSDGLKLTTYFGERDRVGDRFLADALLDVYGRHRLEVSALFRGVEGFGLHHRLHTDRLLTLSEDLPVVAVAVDTRERIERALPDVQSMSGHALVTLERARIAGAEAVAPLEGEAKLTVYVGRKERVDGRPAYERVVALLHERGVAGASVLLGVDGTLGGARQRAGFFGANADVPLMVISVGDGAAIATAAAALRELLPRPRMTLERVRVCRRDGERLGEPGELVRPGEWHKLMVYAGEPLHSELIARLRHAGAAGATALRGIWGYHGDHAPHGDRFWSLRRHVPVLTVIVDTAERIGTAFAIAEEVTQRAGLVTSELVPAFRRA